MEEEDRAGVQRTVRFKDQAVQAGFTQVPNPVLNDGRLSMQAKMAYIALASFAWGPNASRGTRRWRSGWAATRTRS